MRWKIGSLAVLVGLCGSRPALAQFQVTAIELDDDDGRLASSAADGANPVVDADLADYFNSARCGCDNDMTVRLRITPETSSDDDFLVVVGEGDCLQDGEVDTDCDVLFGPKRVRELEEDFELPALKASALMNEACASESRERTLKLRVLILDTNGEYSTEQAQVISYTVDTEPPAEPKASSKQPRAGETLATVYFEAADGAEDELRYQVLCRRQDDPDATPTTSPPEALFDYAGNSNVRACTAGSSGSSNTADGGTSADAGIAVDISDGSALEDAAADTAAAADGSLLGDGDLRNQRFVCSDVASGPGSVQVQNLSNEVTYDFYVVAIDPQANPSQPVFIGSATPGLEEDLWERYKRSGGSGEGGCSLAASSPSMWLLLAAGLAWLLRSRRGRSMRRRRLLGLPGLLLAAWLQPADASPGHEQRSYESPQYFAFEFKLGPYKPNIDSEFDGAASPYADLFGDSSALLFRGEFDVQFVRLAGSLGIGFSAGYARDSAAALVDTGGTGTPSDSSERSAGTTKIELVPISLLAVYRFDWLARRLSIPLVPFAKAGFNYTIWRIKRGDGSTASVDGDDASGGSAGFQFNLGMALQLDVLEPSAAKTLDSDMGINHSYVFIELVHCTADGFGSDEKLNVGDTTWQAGLAFEF